MDKENMEGMDWEIMRGHYHAKRVLEVAASGNHSVLLVGPRHSGKAAMARSLQTILPGHPFIVSAPTEDLGDAIEHACGGVLFLDRLDLWDKPSFAILRETIAQQPGQLLLVATAGACPCGNYADEAKKCVCSQETREAYQRRLSSLVDACFALEVYIPSVNRFASVRPDEPSSIVRERVDAARRSQYQRNGEARLNSALSLSEVQACCPLDAPAQKLLAAAHKQLALSPEQERFLWQVARTIADLSRKDTAVANISAHHLAEAIQYRGDNCKCAIG